MTVPFKKLVIPHVDDLSPEANETQSVNTIFLAIIILLIMELVISLEASVLLCNNRLIPIIINQLETKPCATKSMLKECKYQKDKIFVEAMFRKQLI